MAVISVYGVTLHLSADKIKCVGGVGQYRGLIRQSSWMTFERGSIHFLSIVGESIDQREGRFEEGFNSILLSSI